MQQEIVNETCGRGHKLKHFFVMVKAFDVPSRSGSGTENVIAEITLPELWQTC